MPSKKSNPAKTSFFGDMSAFEAALENVDSSLNSEPTMSVETAARALLDESLKRMSGFVPRADKPQDTVNQQLAVMLASKDAPIDALYQALISAIRSLKVADDTPSNAADCGVTDAPVGTAADQVRDRIESLLLFTRSLNRQVARGSFFRIQQVERQLDAEARRQQSVKKNAAGEFVGTYAVIEDRQYHGWNRVKVDAETIFEAAQQIGEALKLMYERAVTAGTTTNWFASNQAFDFGSVVEDGNYVQHPTLAESHLALRTSAEKSYRERLTADDILAGIKL